MRWMRGKGLLLLTLLLLVCPVMAMGQVATTTLTDTIYHADGTVAGGLVIVSWPAFTTGGGAGGTGREHVGDDCNWWSLLTLALAPNLGATPAGTFYTAVYHLDDGTVSREFWVMPVSARRR